MNEDIRKMFKEEYQLQEQELQEGVMKLSEAVASFPPHVQQEWQYRTRHVIPPIERRKAIAKEIWLKNHNEDFDTFFEAIETYRRIFHRGYED